MKDGEKLVATVIAIGLRLFKNASSAKSACDDAEIMAAELSRRGWLTPLEDKV